MLQVIRVTGEAKRDERRWDALWSYRASPPTVGEGTSLEVVPFNNWLAQLGLGDEEERPGRTLTDEDIKRAFAKGHKTMAVLPPGVKIKEL